MGLFDKKIAVAKDDKLEASKALLDMMIDEDSSLITVFVGEDVTSKEKEELENYIKEKYDSLDYEFKDGGQPVYSFIISVE